MGDVIASGSAPQKSRTSIKRTVFLFSVILFAAILLGGGVAFAVSMWSILHASSGNELAKAVEVEGIKLQASVNSEIAIALKMADSPIIQAYFSNPGDPELERLAFAEIAGYRRAFASKSVFWVNDVDKRFYSDDAFSYVVDTSDPNNYWYLMTLNQTESYNFNINYNPDLNATNLWINAPVFDSSRRPIGILGTGIELTNFIESIYKNYNGDGELYLFNAQGEITGAKDAALVKNKTLLSNELGSLGAEILSRSKNLKPGEFTYFRAFIGEIALGEVPALEWFITAILPITLGDALSSTMTILFVAMIAAIAVIFVVFNVFIIRLLNPLNNMVSALNQISSDWDLTQRLQFHRKDEIGTLGELFNLTFERMKGLLTGIKKKTMAMFDTGDELTANMAETTENVENINSNIRGIRSQILTQADRVNATASSMDGIITGMNKLNEHIAAQATNVSQSSSAIEEMLANIQSVTHTLVKNTENIDLLAKTSEEGRAGLQKVAADIKEIERESAGLLEINTVMATIASQTNLLSMNAAIEAAHAGESGRGFAVVADEIRKLAVNSSEQSKTISTVLKKIKASIDAITKSTDIVLERFGTIEQEVLTVSNQESQIRNAMEEQSMGSRSILEAVTQLNSVTDLVQKVSSDMTVESSRVMNESRELKTITAEVAGNMDEMTESVDQINNMIVRAKEIGEENKENIDTVSTEIARFKVE